MDVPKPYKFIWFGDIPIAQTNVPKIRYLNSWGTKVVLKWPSGGPGAGQSPALGPPEGNLSTTSIPHELRYPVLGTLWCAMTSMAPNPMNS
jgi:hypothetical protein